VAVAVGLGVTDGVAVDDGDCVFVSVTVGVIVRVGVGATISKPTLAKFWAAATEQPRRTAVPTAVLTLLLPWALTGLLAPTLTVLLSV
jgi:hypothetical protein